MADVRSRITVSTNGWSYFAREFVEVVVLGENLAVDDPGLKKMMQRVVFERIRRAGAGSCDVLKNTAIAAEQGK